MLCVHHLDCVKKKQTKNAVKSFHIWCTSEDSNYSSAYGRFPDICKVYSWRTHIYSRHAYHVVSVSSLHSTHTPFTLYALIRSFMCQIYSWGTHLMCQICPRRAHNLLLVRTSRPACVKSTLWARTSRPSRVKSEPDAHTIYSWCAHVSRSSCVIFTPGTRSKILLTLTPRPSCLLWTCKPRRTCTSANRVLMTLFNLDTLTASYMYHVYFRCANRARYEPYRFPSTR